MLASQQVKGQSIPARDNLCWVSPQIARPASTLARTDGHLKINHSKAAFDRQRLHMPMQHCPGRVHASLTCHELH